MGIKVSNEEKCYAFKNPWTSKESYSFPNNLESGKHGIYFQVAVWISLVDIQKIKVYTHTVEHVFCMVLRWQARKIK